MTNNQVNNFPNIYLMCLVGEATILHWHTFESESQYKKIKREDRLPKSQMKIYLMIKYGPRSLSIAYGIYGTG